jgi:cytochrome c553
MALKRGIFWGVATIAILGILGWLATESPRARAADPKPAAASSAKQPEKKTEKIDPLSVNATCYVCHMTFVREQISKVHFKEKVTCIKCHGLSAAHANDEDIGATKPDIMYKREQVDAMCRKCHEEHDAPAHEVIERFLDRKPPASPAVCTDCHGMHRIQVAEEEE